jgi:hypothetical protein
VKKIFTVLLSLLSVVSSAQITMTYEGEVASDALFFTSFQFGARITPHGDCIKVHQGYIFVTWYRGGMDDMAVMLSRKKIGEGTWKHIEFPHKHQMFRGDRTKGDSHNTIAIGISPKDNTIHLLYDMHAYTTTDTQNDYFNYSYSKKNAAIVPDSLWTIDLFYPKQNYLVESLANDDPSYYQRVTYPRFYVSDDGDLITSWRIGGHTNATMYLTRYDGTSWSESRRWNNYNTTSGFYGSFEFFNGKMHCSWSRRMSSDHNLGYVNNRGLYYGYSNSGDGLTDWFAADGTNGGFPIVNQELFKIAEPSNPGQNINRGPMFVVTESGAYHAHTSVSGTTKHYYRLKPEDPLQTSNDGPNETMHAFGDRIYSVYLSNGRPVVVSTQEGTHNWIEEYKVTSGRRYRHGNSIRVGNDLYYYLMEQGSGDKQPIHLLRFTITGDSIGEPPTGIPLFINSDSSRGTVIKSPDKLRYDVGEEVVLTADPKPGFIFENWTGYISSEENPLTIKMDSTIILTANFVPVYTVTISENIVNGTIDISPEKAFYKAGETVSFIPQPAPGYIFNSWYADGGIGGNVVPLVITINRDIELTAYFSLLTYQLFPTAYNGVITRNPHSVVYAAGSNVELTAFPNTGYQFANWSGYITSTENPLIITMDSVIHITANFDLISNTHQNEEVKLNIYPNPSEGIFTVNIGESSSWSVYNLAGVKLKSGKGSGTFQLDLKTYPKGIYFLEILTREGIFHQRLIVE